MKRWRYYACKFFGHDWRFHDYDRDQTKFGWHINYEIRKCSNCGYYAKIVDGSRGSYGGVHITDKNIYTPEQWMAMIL